MTSSSFFLGGGFLGLFSFSEACKSFLFFSLICLTAHFSPNCSYHPPNTHSNTGVSFNRTGFVLFESSSSVNPFGMFTSLTCSSARFHHEHFVRLSFMGDVSYPLGCGSKSKVPFWCRCTTHFSECGLGCSLGVRAFDPWPPQSEACLPGSHMDGTPRVALSRLRALSRPSPSRPGPQTSFSCAGVWRCQTHLRQVPLRTSYFLEPV